MSSALKGKDFREEFRKAKAKDNPKPVNPILEFVEDPQLWDVDDPRYDWLTDEQRDYLKSFPFDWYDIMQCAGHFMTFAQMLTMLMTDERECDLYTNTLWGKPSRPVYDALQMATRNAVVKDIFEKHAASGNSTAMSIMAHSVMRMDETAHGQDMRITIVNDIGDAE